MFLGFSSPSDETINRGLLTIIQVKLLTKVYCDEAGDYIVPNGFSQRDIVFCPDQRTKAIHTHI